MNQPASLYARPRAMQGRDSGYALVVALSLVAILAVVLTTYSLVTVGNTRTSRSSANSSAGFYAAEAALNARAEQIRAKFKGFETPSGTTPTTCLPNVTSGSGDYACKTDIVGERKTVSYVTEGDSETKKIPAGELFENLIAEETNFTVSGQAIGPNNTPEAITSLTFHSRLVPLFQFAVFFDKDLEFTNTATLNLSGPVHTNGNLFLDSGAGSGTALTIQGQVTAANNIYRGWKHANSCGGTVKIADASTVLQTMACTGTSRTQRTGTALNIYGGQVKDRLGELEVPSIEQLQPRIGAQYWDQADVRIVLKRVSAGWEAKFVTQSGLPITVTCPLGTGLSPAINFKDNREAQYWTGVDPTRVKRVMLDVDVRQLLTCMDLNPVSLGLPNGLADTSQGGLVIFMTIDDTTATSTMNNMNPTWGNGNNGAISQTTPGRPNNYAVRLKNGDTLRSNNPSSRIPRGITFVTDQAAFIQGNFNSVANTWIPTAVMSDTINVLSQGWATPTQCKVDIGGTDYFVSHKRLRNINGSVIDTTTTNNTGTQLYVSTPSGAPTTVNTTRWYYYPDTSSAATLAQIDTYSGDDKSSLPLWCRNAAPTTINAAILANTSSSGTSTTFNGEGSLDVAPNSGGVHNMMRFHEEWGGNGYNPAGIIPYTYRGSLVSLNQPLHAIGAFQLATFKNGTNTLNDGDLYVFYNPPLRQWSFEDNFRDAAKLPPLSPRFVYLKQDNFSRSFEQP
ncbi:hypothetical protein [Deinococcus aquatilis]|jgi:hypothetical protein|uniref:hypothetical protein n=1 Tax=Deinococcus aquatilis TaxID=519440 RepID=UPI000372BD7A|nr:hypothetical protein [Deinococcus aquatilis]